MNRSLDLDRNQFVHLRGHPRERVRVTCGRVWVTIEGDLDDHLLTRGQSLPLPRGARVLAQALDAPARLLVHRPDNAWQRLVQVVQGLPVGLRTVRAGTLL